MTGVGDSEGMRKHKHKFVLKRIVNAVSILFPENYRLGTTRVCVASPRLPAAFDGFRIVQISDLHGCRFGAENCRLLAAVAEEKPDLIALTGDIADRETRDYEMIFRFAKALCGQSPVCFAYGNHEQELLPSRRKEFLAGLRKAGVRILDNGSVRLERGGEAIALFGVRVPLRYYRWNSRRRRRPEVSEDLLGRLLGPRGPEYTILLAHNPLYFEAYAAWGADLTLSGHVHGGMLRLPRLGGLLSPERSFFPRYSAGLYRLGGRSMEVSRGLGRGPRVNNPPEVVSITLCRAERARPNP